MKTQTKPTGNPRVVGRDRGRKNTVPSPNLGQSHSGTIQTEFREAVSEQPMSLTQSDPPADVAHLFNKCSAGTMRCSFCDKSQGHEPWCQVSPEWIAMESVFAVADGLSEVTTIEALYDLAKQRQGTECLTLEMVRELVGAWAELGEWEVLNGKYWRTTA